MAPSFDPAKSLDDTIAQAKDRGVSALTWALMIVGCLGVVAIVSGGRRRR